MTNTWKCAVPTESLLRRALASPGDFRLLERLQVADGATGRGTVATGVAVVVDVETMGVAQDDAVIEIALRRIRYDAAGEVTEVGRSYSWRQDPGVPLPEEITRLTGLRDEDVAGQVIDVGAVAGLVASADVRIAHHARFDRPRVEALAPGAAGGAWACSMSEIDWAARGHDGLRLGVLLASCGKWHDAHRAAADVDAVIGLLGHRFEDGRTALSVLLERASQPGWIVEAVGAHFDVKDALKARGYRWDAAGRVWCREVYGLEREREEWWLAANVYSRSARALGPRWTATDWTRRHS